MIKKSISLILILSGILFFGACQNASQKKSTAQKSATPAVIKKTDTGDAPVMTFSETEHDFGKLTQGDIVKYTFHFTNTGKSDLKISHVSTSCGCTVGKYPHQPIKPGEGGDIVVTFNTKYKFGYQNKSIMLLANTKPARTVLHIKAVVVIPKDKK
ncbi:DUF1573 domain-containing protein [Candidatus Sulfidibacterium hydrothermale]|uniref:DUF1573 domain-containing protein n=1 Tax=Candidatus Sulfidibacterium hydrothermale TaxID=2875962 RepID=UPI001F0AF50B|nr:DUF1573 domain-containing protein [Candidatus Sulfidibacterium hydrothermale]UBM61681.1 DUF1573 domain-containing protein [Candidatus Sulfidibacterium hydrothermale]